MKEDKKQAMIRKICFWSNEINGFPATDKNIRYWNLLPDDILQRVYVKWQELYTTGIFFRKENL